MIKNERVEDLNTKTKEFYLNLNDEYILEIEKAFNCLHEWFEKNGYRGYDLSDIKALPFFLLLSNAKKNSAIGKYIARPFFLLEKRHKNLLRKIFDVKKNIYPQAIALISRAYLNAYLSKKTPGYLFKAQKNLQWLENNGSQDFSNMCWGQPFDWFARSLIPEGTPRATVTSIVANAFLDAYEITGSNNYLEIAKSSCEFLINNLNREKDYDGDICFSYTPIDDYCIHNANILVAATLIRTWYHCRIEKYKDIALKSAQFTVKHQNKNGSWYYWAPPSELSYNIDNYHTGFVLEALIMIKEYLSDGFEYDHSLKKGLNFYIHHFFEKGRIPRTYHDSTFPIDIQSCAQSIITLWEAGKHFSNLKGKSFVVAKWTIENMRDKEGYFYYRIYSDGWIDKTPYVRWGESWMLRALSLLLPYHNKEK